MIIINEKVSMIKNNIKIEKKHKMIGMHDASLE